MDSNLLARIHTVSVMLFLLSYIIKTILIFSNRSALEKYTRVTKVPEMIISTLFLVTGIWLFVILGGIKVFHIIKLLFIIIAIPLAVRGFKTANKTLALLSLLFIVGAYGLAEMSKNKPFIAANVKSEEAGTLRSEGAELYFTHCAFCHGADGKKMYREAPDLSLSGLSDEAIRMMIREGSKGKMPAYKDFTDEQLSAISIYVQGLRRQQ